MDNKFGFFVNKAEGVIFDSIQIHHGDDITNKNHPDKLGSPNYPRAEFRLPGYPNPILGDEGYGQIKRWSKMNLDALEVITQQMIEHYVRDKDFYKLTLCREALWNMYRRLSWWVKNQTDPQKTEWENSLLLVRDCIYKILLDAEDGISEGIDLPLCPAPYTYNYSGDYFNHFNTDKTYIKMLDTGSQPVWDRLHGIFRYMSSSEAIKWTIDKSVEQNPSGNENIIKFVINDLEETQSTKMGFNWKFRKKGYISFDYKVKSRQGNGLVFFINGKQVGGEWFSQDDWKPVTYNLDFGQTYRFEWLVRSLYGKSDMNGCVYIKNIVCAEEIVPLEIIPPKTDVSWNIKKNYSVADVYFNGSKSNTSPELILPITTESNGLLSFNISKIAAQALVEIGNSVETISDSFVSKEFTDQSWNGTKINIDHKNWSYDGGKATIQETGKIISDIEIKPETSVEIKGVLSMTCPAPNSIPLGFSETKLKSIGDFTWNTGGGEPIETYPIKVSGTKIIIETNAPNGNYKLFTKFIPENNGYVLLKHTQLLAEGDSIGIYLNDGQIGLYDSTVFENELNIPIEASTTEQEISIRFFKTSGITAVVNETVSETKELFYTDLKKDNDYISAKYKTDIGSTIQHQRYLKNISLSNTIVNKDEVLYTVNLAPKSSAVFSEVVDVMAEGSSPVTTTLFNETFTGGKITTGIVPSKNWEFSNLGSFYDEVAPSTKDVIFVKKYNSVNTLSKSVFSISSKGKLTFDYGGKFTNKDKLELYVKNNGKRNLVWKGNDSTTNYDDKNSISIDLLPGTNELEWVYTDGVEDPDKCFPAGSEKILINYLDNKEVKSKRGLKHWWRSGTETQNNKTNFYTEKGIVNNTDFSTRRFISNTPNFSTVSYQETLTIYRGSKQQPVYEEGTNTDIKIQQPFSPKVDDSKVPIDNPERVNYYYVRPATLPVINTGATPEQALAILKSFGFDPKTDIESVGRFNTNYFLVDGEFNLSFDYECFLYDVVSKLTKAKTYVYLELQGDTKTKIDIATFDFNSSTKDKDYLNLTGNWEGKFNKKVTKIKKGIYRLCFKVVDVVGDSDSGYMSNGGKIMEQFFAFKNLNVKTSMKQVGTKTVYDATSVIVEVRKQGKKDPVDSFSYSVANTDSSRQSFTVNVDFSRYINDNGDGTYYVEYDLKRGDFNAGGLKGTGGGFSLSSGFIEETYPGYCINSNGVEYLQTEKPIKDTWCYLDNIKVTNLTYEAPSPNFNFSVFLNETKTTEIKTTDETTVTIPLENTSDDYKTFIIRYKFLSPNKDKALTSQAKITFTKQKQKLPSSAEFILFDLYKKERIFGGGCGTSTLKAILYDGTNNIISTHVVTPNDANNTFTFNIPSSSVYSNNRLEIVAEMNSEYRLRQTFQVTDLEFKITQKPTSDNFSSSLQVYVDGVLKNFYQDSGTKTIPLNAGKHQIKFVFKRNNYTNSNYDYVVLDWVKVTNWISDSVKVIPYCDEGQGEKCIEALIRCMVELLKNRPTGVVIGTKIWLFT